MPLISKFHIIIHEDSNESHPSMVAVHNMIIEYLIINAPSNPLFWIVTCWLLISLKLLTLLKWFIYWYGDVTFNSDMGRKGNLGDM